MSKTREKRGRDGGRKGRWVVGTFCLPVYAFFSKLPALSLATLTLVVLDSPWRKRDNELIYQTEVNINYTVIKCKKNIQHNKAKIK